MQCGLKVIRDNEYHSAWGKSSGAPPVNLAGLSARPESPLIGTGYQTLALTPRFRGIMDHQQTHIEKATAEALRLDGNWQVGGQARGGPPPSVRVLGQGHVGYSDANSDGTIANTYYQIKPQGPKSLLGGRQAVPSIRLPLGAPKREPLEARSRTTRFAQPPPMIKQNSPQTARRAAGSPRSSKRHYPINTPHRVYPPPFMNAPTRMDPKRTAASLGSPRSDRGGAQERATRRANQERISDYTFKASACKRAGRRRAEANAYYSMGVLFDNNREHLRAIQSYQQFQEVLISTEDKFAQALAHNSIGVAFMNLGEKYYSKAQYHHEKHRDLADIPGKFIAFTNLGIISLLRGDPKASSSNHQYALQCAIRMSSIAGQSVAIGNLGLAEIVNRDFASARVCLERHLKLARELGDKQGEIAALQKLGEIANIQGEFLSAADSFNQAWQTANDQGNTAQADISKVNLGVARATAAMQQRLQEMGQAMR